MGIEYSTQVTGTAPIILFAIEDEYSEREVYTLNREEARAMAQHLMQAAHEADAVVMAIDAIMEEEMVNRDEARRRYTERQLVAALTNEG